MDLTDIIELSRQYGQGTDYVVAGGSASVKDRLVLAITVRDASLRALQPSDLVELSREPLRAARPEDSVRPSPEASLHEMLEWRLVVHTHPFAVNALTCSGQGESAARQLFGEEVLWVPSADADHFLPRRMEQALQAYRTAHRGDPRVVFLQNHGFMVAGDSAPDIRRQTDDVVARIAGRFTEALPRGQRPAGDAVVSMIPALRMLLTGSGDVGARSPKVVSVRAGELAEFFLQPENRRFLSAILAKTGRGTDPRYPVCITADGTTFWQLRAFPARVQFWMRRLLDGEGRAWEIETVEDALLLGAAIAALTN